MNFRWLTLVPLITLISCSSYQRDFKKAAKKFKPQQSPEGPWKGTWKSEKNGHQGPLWCLVSQDPTNPDLWNFRYRAGWGVLQFGDYTHQVATKLKSNGTLPVKGSMTLPKGFGTYSVEGELTPTRFSLEYEGSGDQGIMNLSHP